jgi:hypothetical protein
MESSIPCLASKVLGGDKGQKTSDDEWRNLSLSLEDGQSLFFLHPLSFEQLGNELSPLPVLSVQCGNNVGISLEWWILDGIQFFVN